MGKVVYRPLVSFQISKWQSGWLQSGLLLWRLAKWHFHVTFKLTWNLALQYAFIFITRRGGILPIMPLVPGCPCSVPGCPCSVPGCPCSIPGRPCFIPGCPCSCALSLSVPSLSLAVPGLYDILSLSLVCPRVYSLYIS